MSDNGPTINVTRGSREERRGRSSAPEESARSSGWGVPGPGALVTGVVRGVRNAWWAGLGVLAVAQSAGSKVFDALVEQGKSWEQARREETEKRAQQVQRLVDEGEAIETAKKRVREEVDAVLHNLGVPRRDDFTELRDQVDALSEKIERLSASIEDAEGRPNA